MSDLSVDMPKATPIRQDRGRPHVPHACRSERNVPSMTHPAQVLPLPGAELRQATELAVSAYLKGADQMEQGLTLLAEARLLMEETGLIPAALVPAPRLASVTDLSSFRARRLAVS